MTRALIVCVRGRLPNQFERLVGRLGFWHQDDGVAGADGHCQRILRSCPLDELLDDRQLQVWIGAVLNEGGVYHPGVSFIDVLKAMTSGSPSSLAQAMALAFWIATIDVPAVPGREVDVVPFYPQHLRALENARHHMAKGPDIVDIAMQVLGDIALVEDAFLSRDHLEDDLRALDDPAGIFLDRFSKASTLFQKASVAPAIGDQVARPLRRISRQQEFFMQEALLACVIDGADLALELHLRAMPIGRRQHGAAAVAAADDADATKAPKDEPCSSGAAGPAAFSRDGE